MYYRGLLGIVQLAKHIIEEKDWSCPNPRLQQLDLGELHRESGEPLLAAGAVDIQVDPIECEGQVIAMRADQRHPGRTLPGALTFQRSEEPSLRLSLPLWLFWVRAREPFQRLYSCARLVAKLQCLPPSAKLSQP